jgi:hypothetical protein
MTRFSTTALAGFTLALLTLVTGCYQAPEIINPAYDCACGTIEFNGDAFPLKMAEAIIPDSTNQLSRTYHIVADLRSQEEIDAHVEAHDLTFYMAFESLDDVVYYIQQDSVTHLIQEINHGDDQFPVRDYICTTGSIVIDPAYAGGPETVTFDVEVREQVNGGLVGFPIPCSGSFTATID